MHYVKMSAVKKITSVFIILFLFVPSVNATLLKDKNPFGKRADEIVVDLKTIPEPILSNTKKTLVTENRFGFDVFMSESNWVVEAFLKDIKPGSVVADIGSGYGALTRAALSKNATVISNDISENQLLYNLKHITPSESKNLYLNKKDIRKITFPEKSLNLIMFHRILHFLKGKEITNILNKSYKWLKPGGKIYIVMMSKDHVAFRDKIQYDASKEWPGENLVITETHLPDQAYALPKTLHISSVETLEHHLKEAGFKIEKSDFVSLKKVGTEPNRDGKEAVGIIAMKPKGACCPK